MNLTTFLKKKDFETAYNMLDKQGFVYSISNVVKMFPRCDSLLLYAFLMYAVSKEDTVEKHITICECLIYINPYIYEANSLVYWHIMHALSLGEKRIKAMSWAIEVFGSDPSSPFSNTELETFAKCVIEEEPNNKIAKTILDLSE